MTDDIQNPTADLSDYDWLEFECFASKVDSEGFTYAYENYSPDFEATDMQELASDMGKFRAYFRANAGLVEQWYDAIGGERACDLHNAHVDETRQRANDACLWGVRCTDGYVVHEPSESERDAFVAATLANPSYRQPAALLRRDVPGGEWVETVIAEAASASSNA
ncbi:hypothetical protein KCMC57_64870 (plasmid) [Kitasatospora sp. CMC57]|uniref:Uncharacterized protein n=1 Tax=Kitasatospora sp. CMC57 TaxID=3231513 RepID=A0AB33K3G0_9ACTN